MRCTLTIGLAVPAIRNQRGDDVKNTVTAEQRDAAYHCGIGSLLRAAYQRDFTMMEMGKCKTKFQTFDEWYATLNGEQRERVEAELLRRFS